MVIGATNRFGMLDDALTRPGRFDRVVRVEAPDEQGRADILGVHTRALSLGSDEERRATLAYAAAITPGATGAELASLANEAAIRAVRRGGSVVTGADFSDAAMSGYEARGKAPSGVVGAMIRRSLAAMNGAMNGAMNTDAAKKPRGGRG